MQQTHQRTNLATSDYPEQSHAHKIPRHIALIMDGNGRWAHQRGQPRIDGHRAAVENFLSIVQTCIELEIHYLTLYVFSTENWKRPDYEVQGMLNLVGEFIDRELSTVHSWNVRLLHMGRIDGLDETLKQKVQYALHLTRNNQGMTLAVALNYGGRADLVDAVRMLIAEGIDPDAIDEQMIATHLSTGTMPYPDLIIRTSGEKRMSNFMLWESANSRFWSIPVFWPDFKPVHLYQAIYAVEHRAGDAP